MKRFIVVLVAAAAVIGAYGCASPFHRSVARLDLRARPLETSAAVPARPSAYDAAVKAINERDYSRALDLLQLARTQRPNDPAVMNAFGVAYDKLGRLDLSARYYAQAQSLDPGSPIVQRNLAYSESLRARAAVGDLASVEPAAAPVVTAAAPPPQPVLVVAKAPAPVALIRVAPNGALLIGRGLMVVDASGQGLGQPVKTALADRGWTVTRAPPQPAPTQARTTVVYPAGGEAMAHALARTLQGPVRISACSDRCTRVTLVVGQDLRRWASGARS